MEDVRASVEARLLTLGYDTVPDDRAALDYQIDRCSTAIQADINRRIIPEGLFHTLVDMAAASFLTDKLASGGLTSLGGLDLSARPAISITEGDTSVTFDEAGESAEGRFLSMLDRMAHPPETLLCAYRRLRW